MEIEVTHQEVLAHLSRRVALLVEELAISDAIRAKLERELSRLESRGEVSMPDTPPNHHMGTGVE